MKQKYLSEVIYQLFALIISIIVVHAVYVAVIRPNAEMIQEQQTMMQEQDESFVPDRSVYIVLRDMEQEICIILFFWALSLMGMKVVRTMRERKLLDRSLMQVSPGTSILPEDARSYSRPLQALPEQEQRYLLPRVLLPILQIFQAFFLMLPFWHRLCIHLVGCQHHLLLSPPLLLMLIIMILLLPPI
jgi:hypothetical protein